MDYLARSRNMPNYTGRATITGQMLVSKRIKLKILIKIKINKYTVIQKIICKQKSPFRLFAEICTC